MIQNIELSRIEQNPWQTRIGEPSLEYVKELALDIAQNGLMQNPVGRFLAGTGHYQLAFGHNRLAAYKWLADVQNNSNIEGDWSCMPVDVRELSDEQMALMAWSENEKRRDVTPIERALAIQRRIQDFGWSNRQCAEHLGIDHSTISNILRLLKLPQDVQEALGDGRLSERQAVALIPLMDIPKTGKPVDSYYQQYNSPERVIKDAIDGGLSSGAIRSNVNHCLSNNSQDLTKAEFELDQLIPEGDDVYCGLCSTCDRRMPSRNLCFDYDCFKAKTEFVHRQYLMQASVASGYELVDAEKGGNPTGLPWHAEDLAPILASKCSNLRLRYENRVSENDPREIPGYEHAYLVCDKRNDSCTCIKGLRNLSKMGETPVQATDAGDLEDVVRQARKAKQQATTALPEIRKQLEAMMLEMMMIHHVGALFAGIRGYAYPSGRDLDPEYFYQGLVKKAAEAVLPMNYDSMDDLMRQVNKRLETLGLEKFEPETEPA